MSEWGDISICWSGIRKSEDNLLARNQDNVSSGVTYLSVGPESG